MTKRSIEIPNLAAAMDYCDNHGFGYDVMHPNFKYHARKSYTENFKFKGFYKEAPEED